MKVTTTRFGEIDVQESDLISMQGSILGFEDLRNFILLTDEKNTPFRWLQSVESPSVAFVVINPRVVKPDYSPHISDDDFSMLDISKGEDIALLCIVTIRTSPFQITANLRAPLLINAAMKKAAQVVLSDNDYDIQYNVLAHKKDVNENPELEKSIEMQAGITGISP